LLLRKPLRWLEDRRENFVATVGERDQDWDLEMAVDAEGRVLNSNPALVQMLGYESSEQMNAEIANIKVLKDIGETAIYGSEGANGVIIITTKRALK